MKKSGFIFLYTALCIFANTGPCAAASVPESGHGYFLLANNGQCYACANMDCSVVSECNGKTCNKNQQNGTKIDGYVCKNSYWETCDPNICECDQTYSTTGCTQPTNGASKRYQACSGTNECNTSCTKSAGNCSITCNKGFYLSGSICEPCSGGGTTSGTGATSVNSCYIPAGTAGSDSTGSFTYTSDCPY
ncbi:MAG: hypothetical protein LBJ73_00815 [Rickettsiales bacterium]|nr:hypothetical protein [Rickettsiales bacterium]